MSTTTRYNRIETSAGRDNTARNVLISLIPQAILVYAASIALKLFVNKTIAHFAQLTGALTVTAETTRPQIGDELVMMFETDGTQRIVTFGTGFVSSGTLTIPASKKGTVQAIFDGAAWRVFSREISA